MFFTKPSLKININGPYKIMILNLIFQASFHLIEEITLLIPQNLRGTWDKV